jgi:hypothetical protein
MGGKYWVTNELLRFWLPNSPGMYAPRFFDASITIMATVGGFPPSQSVGVISGLGVRKEDTPLSYYSERSTGLSIRNCGEGGRAPLSLIAGLLFSEETGTPARSIDLRFSTQDCSTFKDSAFLGLAIRDVSIDQR